MRLVLGLRSLRNSVQVKVHHRATYRTVRNAASQGQLNNCRLGEQTALVDANIFLRD